MKILKCIICNGELDLLDNKSFIKTIKCRKCGFSNLKEDKEPEIFIIKKPQICE